MTSTVGPEIGGKQVELLKEAVPKVSRMAVLWNPSTPGNALALREAESAARALKVALHRLEARRLNDFESAFAAMGTRRAGALLILGDVMFTTYRIRLAHLAVKHRLPAIYGDRHFVDEGGLISYGGDLPIERSTKFELVINLRTARALGLTIPPRSCSGQIR